MDSHQKITVHYKGVILQWSFYCTQKKSGDQPYSQTFENRFFRLSFHRKYREIKEMKLYVNKINVDYHKRLWSSVTLSHTSTFDTFANRKEFYRGVGRSGKQGYLLYRPPGTCKPSLIAAIANFLDFDICDLELRTVRDNSQLREFLTSTKSKSIIVVEDIDYEKPGQREKTNEAAFTTSLVNLSGVLNFVDGLWSSCGGKRIRIFATNHKENLDPALLSLSYCGFEAFKVLAKNYCGLNEKHPLICDDPDLAMDTVLEDLLKRQASDNESPKFIMENITAPEVIQITSEL
ncbi:hypothetical protein AMTRI_Chr02g214520 [Amborella trichopoda]